MPSVRLDRLLASTAIVLLLSAAAGGALAEPISDAAHDTAASVSNDTTGALLTKADSVHAPAKPADSAGETQTPAPAATGTPAPSPNPEQSTGQPEAPASPVPAATVTPNSSPKPEESASQPTVPSPKLEESASQPTLPSPKPEESAGQPAPAAPAAAATPDSSTKPAESAGQPAAPAAVATPTPKPDQSTEEPVAPTAAGAPPTNEKPAASTGEGAVPTATAPAAVTPVEPGASPTPSVVVDANAAIAEQLRELANGKFDHTIGSKKERTAIDAFYSDRNYAPLWITDGKANTRAEAAIAYLGQVDADGLDPADYPVPDFTSLTDPAALAAAEIRLTTSVVTYAHHAEIGRVHWSRVSADISYDRKPPDPAEVLANMAGAKDVSEALASYEPHVAPYLALKAKLAELRAGKTDARGPRIASGPALKVGMQDERVPVLRERLGVGGDAGTTYDKTLADAVKKFQQEHELKASGTLTSATVEALNGRRPDRPTDIIIANMERWRWMPRDLGKTYVMVNLPDFSLRVFHDGRQVWMTRIVDGKPTMPTPIMSAEMKYITVNPTWNVPPSIVANEYLPALQQDPTILERAGLNVSRNPDGTIHISQPPGDRNALGRLRFNFPNKFLVYQHDTPDKYMFAYDKRAFSHGCMRVQDPAKYAEVLLSFVRPGQGYTEDRIRQMFGSGETDIQFPTFIPVHLTYQTAFVDNKGKLEFREDIYGRDRALLAVLKSDERKVADIPIEHKENAVRRQVLAIPDQPTLWGGQGYADGGAQGFFARLFGNPFGGPAPAPLPRNRAVQRGIEIR